MPDFQEYPHFWTYNDTRLEELDRDTLIEALTLACESNAELQEQVWELRKQQVEDFRAIASLRVAGNA